MARCAESKKYSRLLASLLKGEVFTKPTASPIQNQAEARPLVLQQARRQPPQTPKLDQRQTLRLPKSLQPNPKLRAKQKANRRARPRAKQKRLPKANKSHTWPVAMRTKLIDQWYAICRDASRQRLVIISLSVLSALFYLVTALGFTSSASVTTVQEDRYEIPAGFRAVATQSVGPLPDIRAGDYVDVIIDATVALDRVLVINVASQPGRQATVVLAVPLLNAPQIADAASLGIVALVLVG